MPRSPRFIDLIALLCAAVVIVCLLSVLIPGRP